MCGCCPWSEEDEMPHREVPPDQVGRHAARTTLRSLPVGGSLILWGHAVRREGEAIWSVDDSGSLLLEAAVEAVVAERRSE
jgi:hypothetical protein